MTAVEVDRGLGSSGPATTETVLVDAPRMLLSRVAEAVYWTGRYLERAEATGRIIKVHTELYLDLPKSAGIGWLPLLGVMGSTSHYEQLHRAANEEDVVSFLTTDARNPGSILRSLEQARANMRTTRPVFPRELWEGVNRLYLRVEASCDDAVPRRTRLAWFEELLGECQRLTGMMAGAMSHDDAYSFLRIGRHLERADMTSRVLDVHAGTAAEMTEQARPYADVTWMSVLRSLSAYQMYRRRVQASIDGADVLQFLLRDAQFPRSVEHCLIEISRCLLELPRHESAMAMCAAAAEHVADDRVGALAWGDLHAYADALQQALGDLHDTVADSFFLPVAA